MSEGRSISPWIAMSPRERGLRDKGVTFTMTDAAEGVEYVGEFEIAGKARKARAVVKPPGRPNEHAEVRASICDLIMAELGKARTPAHVVFFDNLSKPLVAKACNCKQAAELLPSIVDETGHVAGCLAR